MAVAKTPTAPLGESGFGMRSRANGSVIEPDLQA